MWLTLLREFGFPVVVAFWFMFRQERRTDRMIELQNQLMMAVQLLAKSVDGLSEDADRAEEEAFPDSPTAQIRRLPSKTEEKL